MIPQRGLKLFRDRNKHKIRPGDCVRSICVLAGQHVVGRVRGYTRYERDDDWLMEVAILGASTNSVGRWGRSSSGLLVKINEEEYALHALAFV